MSNSKEFNIKFWGTRGSIPCPGPSTVKYGGNTTSFELNCGGRRILVDAGTGIRMLGKEIMLKEGNLLNADLFFTHTHMDHIQGASLSLLRSTIQNSDVRIARRSSRRGSPTTCRASSVRC